jgi:uncharacterized protein DUF4154
VAVVRFRRWTWLAAVLLVLHCGRAHAQSTPATENQVKAVFLYNFTKYVGWPPEAFAADSALLNVCVLGRDPFGPALEATLRGESVNERSLAARHVSSVEEVAGCQILFISDSEERELAAILRGVAGKPILTVGEMDKFAESGGMIRLRKIENKIRLEINEASAARAGLKISSQLLKLARIVASSPS